MILSLDLSTKSSGWSVFDGATLVDYGCITASSTDVVKRIIKITDELNEIIKLYPIEEVIMEEVLPSVGHNSNTNVWKALTWLQASVVFMIHNNYPKVTRTFILPNSWRAKCGIHTGRGITRQTLKAADIKFVKDNYDIEVNDDIADAILIGHSQVNKLSEEINFE